MHCSSALEFDRSLLCLLRFSDYAYLVFQAPLPFLLLLFFPSIIFYQAVWWWIRPSVLDSSCSLHPVLFPELPAQWICPRRPNSSWGRPEHPWQPPGHLPWHPVWKLLLPGMSCWHTLNNTWIRKQALRPCSNNSYIVDCERAPNYFRFWRRKKLIFLILKLCHLSVLDTW